MGRRCTILWITLILAWVPACVAGGGGGKKKDKGDDTSVNPPPDASDVGPHQDATPSDSFQPQPDTAKPPQDTAQPPPPGSEMVDPQCLDGQYAETMPNPSASLQALLNGYSPAGYLNFILSALDLRYPIGGYLVAGALENLQIGNCVDFFLGQKDTGEQVIDQLSTIVHECGHFLDMGFSGFGEDTYFITDKLSITCKGGTKFEYGGETFVRSELLQDQFVNDYPPCAPGTAGADCDFYATTYLTGNSGNQGFNMLFEEAVQYVNSLATGYAFNDFNVWSSSERDGILTFLWYIERYLYRARTKYPDTYAFLSESECWRSAILTLWGRAWLFLATTEGMSTLGIADDLIEPLVADPLLLKEIQSLRDLHGCK